MHWQNSSNFDDVGIVDLRLYAIIFSFIIKLKAWRKTKDPEEWSILYTDIFFFYSVRGI